MWNILIPSKCTRLQIIQTDSKLYYSSACLNFINKKYDTRALKICAQYADFLPFLAGNPAILINNVSHDSHIWLETFFFVKSIFVPHMHFLNYTLKIKHIYTLPLFICGWLTKKKYIIIIFYGSQIEYNYKSSNRFDVLQGFAITQMIVIMTSRLNKSMNKPNTTDTYISYLLESNTNIIFWLHLGINLKKYCPKEIQRKKKILLLF